MNIRITMPRIAFGSCTMAVPQKLWVKSSMAERDFSSDPFENMQIFAARSGIREIPTIAVEFFQADPVYRLNFSQTTLHNVVDKKDYIFVKPEDMAAIILEPAQLPIVTPGHIANFLTESIDVQPQIIRTYYRSLTLNFYINNFKGYLPGGRGYRPAAYAEIPEFNFMFDLIDQAVELATKDSQDPQYRATLVTMAQFITNLREGETDLATVKYQYEDIGGVDKVVSRITFHDGPFMGRTMYRSDLLDWFIMNFALPLVDTTLEIAASHNMTHKDFGMVL